MFPEGVGEQILPGPVELKTACHLSGFQEGIPCELVDLFVIFSLLVGHDELQVIAAAHDMKIGEESLFLSLVQHLLPLFQYLGVRAGMAHVAADIGLYDT